MRGFKIYISVAGLKIFIFILKFLNLPRLNLPETLIIFLNIKNPITIRKKLKIKKNLIKIPK